MTDTSQTSQNRRRTTVIAVIVVAVLVLAGGGLALALATGPAVPASTAAASATPAGTPTPTATRAPTSSATPTVAPTPAIDLSAPQTWIVSTNTVGPITRGQSMEEAAAALSTAYALGDAGCPVTLYQSKVSRGVVVLTPDESGKRVRSIFFTSSLDAAAPSPRTAEGIGFGSTAAEIVAAYPGIQRPQPDRYPTYSLKQADGSWIDFRVAEDGGQVIDIDVTYEDYPPSEFCG